MPKSRIYFVVPVLFLFFSLSCQKGLQTPGNGPYDIILLMGQSNTLAGQGFNEAVDFPQLGINQLGRFAGDNYKIILATEPLQNSTPFKGCIGFALTFAKLYASQRLEKGREILIIPCGASATGFKNAHWNRGDDLYTDAVNRVNFVLESYPGSKIKCFLWHQGETDYEFGAAYYQVLLEKMIKGLYVDVKAKDVSSIPFIMGGFVPYVVSTYKRYKSVDSALRVEPTRLPVAGFADPLLPFIIKKPVDTVDAIHFDANGQREMGKRYFSEYIKLEK